MTDLSLEIKDVLTIIGMVVTWIIILVSNIRNRTRFEERVKHISGTNTEKIGKVEGSVDKLFSIFDNNDWVKNGECTARMAACPQSIYVEQLSKLVTQLCKKMDQRDEGLSKRMTMLEERYHEQNERYLVLQQQLQSHIAHTQETLSFLRSKKIVTLLEKANGN